MVLNKKNEVKYDARYRSFTITLKPLPPQSLPPTKDALYLHLERASCQCFRWKKSLDCNFSLPNPISNGRLEEEDGSLAIPWTRTRPSPESMLEFISCFCSKSECQTFQYSCFDRTESEEAKDEHVGEDFDNDDESDSSYQLSEGDLHVILEDW